MATNAGQFGAVSGAVDGHPETENPFSFGLNANTQNLSFGFGYENGTTLLNTANPLVRPDLSGLTTTEESTEFTTTTEEGFTDIIEVYFILRIYF